MLFPLTRVTPAELSVLRDLAEQTFRTAWQDQNDPADFEAYCAQAFTLEKFADELAHPGSEFYLVWDGKTAVAYLKLNFDCTAEGLEGEKTVQIERIYVLTRYQGRGIGEALLACADQRARAVGASWLWLSVWQKAPRSQAFYERHGYTVFGTDIFVVGADPQLDWLMRKRI